MVLGEKIFPIDLFLAPKVYNFIRKKLDSIFTIGNAAIHQLSEISSGCFLFNTHSKIS